MEESLKETVLEIVADTFGVSVDMLNEKSAIAELPTWDSLLSLNLILALEDSFGIRFSVDEAETMITIADIIAVLEKKTAHETV